MREIAIAALLVAAVGCGSSGGPSGGVLPPAGPTVTLSDVQAQVFTPRCATGGCHVGAGAPFGLDLGAGQSHGKTVGVASSELPTFQRVEPGNALDSYLYMKVAADPRILGDPMPLLATPLSDQQLALIVDWIEQGANP